MFHCGNQTMDFFRYEYKNATDINIKIQLGQCNLQQKDKWQRQKFRDYTCQLIKKKNVNQIG